MDVTIASTDRPINAYLTVPDAASEQPAAGRPGVVVVHDAIGLSDDIRSLTDRFSAAGYLAIAPNLYARGGLRRCVRTVFQQMSAGEGQAHDDISAARDFLAARDDCSGRIGIAGFCLGGGFALVGAIRGFDASAPYYGRLPADLSILDGACPIVASFGGRDRTLRGAAEKLTDSLTEHGVPHDVKEYPNAGHSFANKMPVGPFGPLLKVAGFGYDSDADQDAWRRVNAFFDTHLSGQPQ